MRLGVPVEVVLDPFRVGLSGVPVVFSFPMMWRKMTSLWTWTSSSAGTFLFLVGFGAFFAVSPSPGFSGSLCRRARNSSN